MKKPALRVVTVIASIIWLGILLNLVVGFPPPWDKVLLWFGLGLLIVHGLELAMFHKLLGASGNPKWLDSLLIIITGAFHASYLARERAERSSVAP